MEDQEKGDMKGNLTSFIIISVAMIGIPYLVAWITFGLQ